MFMYHLMPADAHKIMPDGSVQEVPLSELALDTRQTWRENPG
jgi:hypothetical protein